MLTPSFVFSKSVNDAISCPVVVGSIVENKSFLTPPCKRNHLSFTIPLLTSTSKILSNKYLSNKSLCVF